MLKNSHAFKKQQQQLHKINLGIFTYPILMTSDILLYNAKIIPVGKDQLQHLEIAKSIVKKFNKKYGKTFNLPIAKLNKNSKIILGIDGKKMSKSYNNTIDIFTKNKNIKKKIMNIKTNNASIKKPKNPNKCNVFKIYKTLSNKIKIKEMYIKYIKGNYKYSESKNMLYNLILKKFYKERKLFLEYKKNIKIIEKKLEIGEKIAKKIAKNNIKIIKKKIGLS